MNKVMGTSTHATHHEQKAVWLLKRTWRVLTLTKKKSYWSVYQKSENLLFFFSPVCLVTRSVWNKRNLLYFCWNVSGNDKVLGKVMQGPLSFYLCKLMYLSFAWGWRKKTVVVHTYWLTQIYNSMYIKQ